MVAKHNRAEAQPRPHASRTRPAQSRAADLDRLIHEPVRLGIVSALAVNETMTFNQLKDLLKTLAGLIEKLQGVGAGAAPAAAAAPAAKKAA